jgi:hypothetical protein
MGHSRWIFGSCALAGAAFSARTALELWRQREYAGSLLGPSFALHWLGSAVGAALGLAWALRSLRRGSTPLAPQTLLGLALFTGVLTWLYQLAFFQPFALLTWSTAMSHGFAAFCVLLWAAPVARARLPDGLRRVGGRALVSLALVPPLFELGVRLAGSMVESPLTDRRGMGASEFIERQRRPGQVRFGFPCDQRGHFDLDPRLQARPEALVVAIGDSFSQGCVPHPLHFTTVAEGRLGHVAIYNMGLAAIGPPEYLQLLESEALALEPDLILVNLFVGNDVALPARRTGLASFLGQWFERREVALCTLPVRLERLRRTRRAAGEDAGKAPGETRLAREPLRSFEDLRSAIPWLEDPFAEPPGMDPLTFAEVERNRMMTACRPKRSDYAPLFAALEAILAKAKPRPVGVVLIPDEYQVEDPLWEELEGDQTCGVERFYPQRCVLGWLAERGVPALDLLAPLRQVEPLSDGRRHLYHLRDTHFNVRGNRVAGLALADFVRGLLAGRAQAPAADSGAQGAQEE